MPEISEYHTLTPSSFQDLIVELFNARAGKNIYFTWGKSGQRQNGIDVYSSETRTVIQCKYKTEPNNSTKKILKDEIKNEVEKVVQSGIKFDQFILVSTYKHDVELQHFSLELRDKKKYPFNINYIGWDELRKWILRYPVVLKQFFETQLRAEMVELVSINIDSEACSWHPVDDYENVFYDTISKVSPFPVLDFSFVNHYNKTIVLKSIHLFVKKLYSGLSGLPSPPQKLESLHTYKMEFQYGKQNILRVNPPIQVGADQAFRFKLQLLIAHDQEGYQQIEGRNVLFFSFDFNSDIKVFAPKVFLNTKDESNKIKLVYSD